MPTVSSDRSTTAGAAAIFTPSASYTSALPHWLETDRLPCFATRSPAAAATSAAADEILNVPDRSPPVPHVSNTSSNGLRQLHGVGAHRLGEPDDFRRPLAFHRQADQQRADLRRRRLAAHDGAHRLGRLVDREVLAPHQFFQQPGMFMFARGRHTFKKFRSRCCPSRVMIDSGMKLHAVNRICAMPQRHHCAVFLGLRRNFQLLGPAVRDRPPASDSARR